MEEKESKLKSCEKIQNELLSKNKELEQDVNILYYKIEVIIFWSMYLFRGLAAFSTASETAFL
jgi:predicted nucleic acid-binding Zn ribbon protein